MSTKIYVVFYSLYSHVYQMAEAVVKGAKEVKDTEVCLFQVPELMPDDALEKSGAKETRESFSHVTIITPDQLADADAIIFGTPTRFGNMAAQMRNFLDQTGGLWMKGGLIGKVGSVFTSTGTQHGGQETTITSFHTTLLFHHASSKLWTLVQVFKMLLMFEVFLKRSRYERLSIRWTYSKPFNSPSGLGYKISLQSFDRGYSKTLPRAAYPSL